MKTIKLILVVLITLSFSSVAQIGYYKAKASIAQRLLEKAWSNTLKQPSTNNPPWPWADIWPELKLTVGSHEFIVLANASGESLAFGPGLLTPKLLPGQTGNSLIAAHRDTHFEFLQQLKKGQLIKIQYKNGQMTQFEIDQISIVDSTKEKPIN